MKNIFTLLFSCLIISSAASAQCSVTVPANAEIISGAANGWVQKVTSNKNMWLCKDGGDCLFLTGDTNVLYTERNDTLTVDGNGNTIYLKEGCKLTLSGTENFVYREKSKTDLVDNGTFTSDPGCPGLMVYAYSDTVNGCDIWAGIDQKSFAAEVKLYPIPATDQLMISLPEIVRETVFLTLRDLNGKVASNLQLDGIDQPRSIDVSSLTPGMYMINIRVGINELNRKILVQ